MAAPRLRDAWRMAQRVERAMEEAWRPIGREEFDALVTEQEAALTPGQRAALQSCRVEPWQATLRRTDAAGDEVVWVLARRGRDVLYFDDVEWGWNVSDVDESGRILNHACPQLDLCDIVGYRI